MANQLSSLNPTWGDETLFQETRRIVITKLVLIVYREFLPVVLGKSRALKLRCRVLPSLFRFRGYADL